MNRITFDSPGQDDPPILNPRLKPWGDGWAVVHDRSDKVTQIGKVISVPDPPSVEQRIVALNNLHAHALAELEAVLHALTGMRAGITGGASAAELVSAMDAIINDTLDLHGMLS